MSVKGHKIILNGNTGANILSIQFARMLSLGTPALWMENERTGGSTYLMVKKSENRDVLTLQ